MIDRERGIISRGRRGQPFTLGLVAVVGAMTLAFSGMLPDPPSRLIRVPEDAPTLQAAIDAAAAGDTVLVAPGVYRGPVVIDKTIRLASRYFTTGDVGYIGRTVLDGTGAEAVITVAKDVEAETEIAGFTICNAQDGIKAAGRLFVHHNHILHTYDGIDFEGGGGTVSHNVIEQNRDDAVDLDGSADVVIEHNVLRDNADDGIEVRLHPHAGRPLAIVIRNNVITGNQEDGIQLIDYPGLSPRVFHIEGNLIANNRMAGLGMMADGNTVEDYSAAPIPEPVYLTNNTFSGHDHAVSGGAAVTARNNIFVGASRLGLKNVAGASTVRHRPLLAQRDRLSGVER